MYVLNTSLMFKNCTVQKISVTYGATGMKKRKTERTDAGAN